MSYNGQHEKMTPREYDDWCDEVYFNSGYEYLLRFEDIKETVMKK